VVESPRCTPTFLGERQILKILLCSWPFSACFRQVILPSLLARRVLDKVFVDKVLAVLIAYNMVQITGKI
jgi:hypothetical protein